MHLNVFCGHSLPHNHSKDQAAYNPWVVDPNTSSMLMKTSFMSHLQLQDQLNLSSVTKDGTKVRLSSSTRCPVFLIVNIDIEILT